MTDSVLWPEDLSINANNGDFTLAEEDFYDRIKIIEIKDVQNQDPKYDKTGTKKQAKFVWRIYGDPRYEDGEVGGQQFFTLSLNEKANLYPIAKATVFQANGGKVDPDHKVKPEEFLDVFFKAKVEHTKPNDKGQQFARIVPASVSLQRDQSYGSQNTEDVPF